MTDAQRAASSGRKRLAPCCVPVGLSLTETTSWSAYGYADLASTFNRRSLGASAHHWPERTSPVRARVLGGPNHHALARKITWFAPAAKLHRVPIPPALSLHEML